MNDALVVGRREGIRHGHPDIDDPLDGHTALRNAAIERLTVHELHGEELDAVDLLDGEDGHDIGVIERGEGLCFV